MISLYLLLVFFVYGVSGNEVIYVKIVLLCLNIIKMVMLIFGFIMEKV